MEYLVNMTTHVPDGTAADAVDEVRAREAEHSRELARDGQLLRLWRPPVQPGEWRTFGLFAAADEDALERVLASMPLRIWRTDEVTPLSAHPNDPSQAGITTDAADGPEFLITMTITPPADAPTHLVADTMAREAERARELAGQGHLLRLWALAGGPDHRRTLGLWRAHDHAEMAAIVEALPLYAWMDVDTTPLTEHPSDPAIQRDGSPA
jgi:muconolactone delta-isomerase